MYRCRAITPPLYNTKRKNGYPTFCSAAAFFGCHKNYVPHFPDTRICRPRKYSASADRENTAKTAMPKTFFGCLRQQIFQQPVMTEWVWGNARREKRRDLFLKDFLSEQSVGNRFLIFCLFIRQKTAKRDKKTVYFTKNSQNTCLNRPQKTGGRLTASARFKRKDIQQYINNTSSTPKILD